MKPVSTLRKSMVTTPALSEEDELLALRTAIEATVRPEDLKQGLEVYASAAMASKVDAPKGYDFMLEPTPSNCGLIAVLMHFSSRGWHGDNITAVSMRIRSLMETLAEYDWVAVNLFKMSEDHASFEFDARLIQAGAAAKMRYDVVAQTSIFDKQGFINQLLYLLSRNAI